MTTLNKQAVTDNATGAIRKHGRTDFSGQYNPATQTLHTIIETAQFVDGIPPYHHKVIAGDVVEMSPAEKAAVDAAIELEHAAKLKTGAQIRITVPNLAALPLPPPKFGVIIGVASIGGSPGIAISTNTNYIVFVSTGIHP